MEICEYVVRGKGDYRGFLSLYQLKPFQFRHNEIIKVVNMSIGVSPGGCITAKCNGAIQDVHSFVRGGDDAVKEISQFRAV